MSVLELFCAVDDFLISFAPQLKASQLAAGQQRTRAGQLYPSAYHDHSDPFSSITLPYL
jgi:hypothetical protein